MGCIRVQQDQEELATRGLASLALLQQRQWGGSVIIGSIGSVAGQLFG